jgi:DNA-binding LytR/AlgR family response regulator
MIQPITILIVEDDMVIAANISLQLIELGYEVTGIITRGEDALKQIKNNLPEIVLMDIQLKGSLNGIETAIKMKEHYHNLAIIYLTANDEEVQKSHPYAYISKPVQKPDLKTSIELTIHQLKCNNKITSGDSKQCASTYVLKDCLFIRHHDSMVKVDIKAIRYIEAERNYSRIYSTEKEFLLVATLKEMDEKLPNKHFLRIHRSYIINLSRIDEIACNHVVILRKIIPMTKGMRPKLLKRLQTI